MFRIPIKLEAHERRRKSIPLLHVVAGLFLLANAASLYKYVGEAWVAIPFFVVAAVSIIYGVGRKRFDAHFKYNSHLRMLQAAGFLAIAIIVVQHNSIKSIAVFLWVAISVLLFFAEKQTVKPSEVLFDADGITLPGNYTAKVFQWQRINAVTLRPDFITLHLQQNKMLQVEPLVVPDALLIENLQAFCNSNTTSVERVL